MSPSPRIERLRASLEQHPVGGRALELLTALAQYHGPRTASAMAFDLFLALVPLLAVFGWLSSHVLSASEGSRLVVSRWLSVAPEAVTAVVTDNVGRFSGAAAPLALVGSLWLASSAFHTLITTLERSMHSERRGFWRVRLMAVAWVLLGGAVAAGVGTLLLGLARELALLGLNGPGLGPWPGRLGVLLALLGGTTLLAAFYRTATHRPWVKRRVVWRGALFGATLGVGASIGLGLQVRTLQTYAIYYGSLAAVAIVMIWLWLVSLSLLLGAELNARAEDARVPPPDHAAGDSPSLL